MESDNQKKGKSDPGETAIEGKTPLPPLIFLKNKKERERGGEGEKTRREHRSLLERTSGRGEIKRWLDKEPDNQPRCQEYPCDPLP